MSKQIISSGVVANDNTGDNLRNSAGKINANFNELYSALGNGTTLSVSAVAKTGNYADLSNKPSIPTDVNQLADSSNLLDGGTSITDNITLVSPDSNDLYDIYQESLMVLNDNFVVANYTGLGYPASKNSYDQILRAKAVNPLIPDAWIPLSKTIQDNYFGWAASTTSLTANSSGFTIQNANNVGWRFEEATGLRFPNNTFQNTAYTGVAPIANRIVGNVDQDVEITVKHKPTVSAQCWPRGGGDNFVADITDNDDITVVQEGWTVDIDGTIYTVTTVINNSAEFEIYATGANFVVGTTYTFTNPTATLQTWTFNSDTATLVAPGGAILSSESTPTPFGNGTNRDFSIELMNQVGDNEHRWAFGNEGTLSLPQGSIIGETTTTTSITPPGAQIGQSLVIRPTSSLWTVTSSGNIEYGNPITISVNLLSWSYFGTVNYEITGPGVTEESLGRPLTGNVVFEGVIGGPDTKDVTWTIPANSNITEFTFTLTSVNGTRSTPADPFDPSLYYNFEDNALPTGNYVTVTNDGVSNSEASHVHLVAGDPTTTDIYLGDDDQYVKIEKNGGNVVIGTNTNTNQWTFDTDGNLNVPGFISSDIGFQFNATGNNNLQSVWTHNVPAAHPYPTNPLLNATAAVVDIGYTGVVVEVNTEDRSGIWRFAPNGQFRIPPDGDITDHAGNSLLTNTMVAKSTNIEITNAELNYDNAVAAWEYARANDYHYAVEQGTATEEGWPFSVWYVNGTNAEQYLTELETAWQIQQMPTSPPSQLIFNPPISSALYANIRAGIVYVRNSYQLWQGLLSSVDVIAGATKLSVLSNDKLVVPDLIQTNPDEDLVIRTRYSLMSSPPGSSTNYQNRDFVFGTNGALTFPNGTMQYGAAIDLVYLKAIVADSTDFNDFKNRIASL